MFVHVATLYSLRAEAADAFIRSIRIGGDWHRIARQVAPDLIASDLLQHQSSPSLLFLCIDFWLSREKYRCVRESAVYDPLFRLRDQLAAATIEIGVFSFPPAAESDAALPQIADLCARANSQWAR